MILELGILNEVKVEIFTYTRAKAPGPVWETEAHVNSSTIYSAVIIEPWKWISCLENETREKQMMYYKIVLMKQL